MLCLANGTIEKQLQQLLEAKYERWTRVTRVSESNSGQRLKGQSLLAKGTSGQSGSGKVEKKVSTQILVFMTHKS